MTAVYLACLENVSSSGHHPSESLFTGTVSEVYDGVRSRRGPARKKVVRRLCDDANAGRNQAAIVANWGNYAHREALECGVGGVAGGERCCVGAGQRSASRSDGRGAG